MKSCLEVASIAEEEGRSVEVIDLRSLSPIDMVTITDSIRRTRRAIVVHEAHRTLGLGAELAARLSEELYYTMEAPVLRVTGYDTPYPWSRVEEDWLPNADRILDAIDESMGY